MCPPPPKTPSFAGLARVPHLSFLASGSQSASLVWLSTDPWSAREVGPPNTLPDYPMDFDQEITQNLSPRARFLYCFLMVGFIIIFGRLWELQVLRGDYFFDLSENNRMKMQEIPAPRGCVYDRQGRILASNLPLLTFPSFGKDPRT